MKALKTIALKTRILRRLDLTKHLFYFESLVLQGQKFQIPILRGHREAMLYMSADFMYDTISILSEIVPLKDFVDIGANCGYTLLQLRMFSREIQYYGFEPNPTSFYLLSELAAKNNLPGALFPAGCSDQNMLVPIFKSDATDGAATILPEIRPNLYKDCAIEYVACYRLDDVLDKSKLSKNFFLKIDVEGAELKVLQGAADCIASLRPIICCEVMHADCEAALDLSRKNKAEIKNFVQDLNYDIFAVEYGLNVDKNNPDQFCLKKFSPIEIFPVKLFEDAPYETDFLFVPKELSESVRGLKTRETANQA